MTQDIATYILFYCLGKDYKSEFYTFLQILMLTVLASSMISFFC